MQIGRYDQIARSPRHHHAGGAAPETGGAVSGGVASGAVPGAAGDGTAAAESAARATREATAAAEDEHGLSFWDVLDVINPLQHIPIVNRLYRAVTGDEIREPARLAGSALLFGPVGLAVAAADMVLEKETGSDAFTHVASLFKGKDAAPDGQEEEQVLLAAADPAEAPAAAPSPPSSAAGTAGQAPAGQLRRAAVPEPLTAAASVPYTADASAPLPGQARGLAAMPAGSAAAMALSGLPAAAAVGSLPAPGDGAQLAELAAGAKEAAGRDAPRGMDLSRYRRLAEAGGPIAPKSIVPPTPVQSAQGAAFVAATAHPPPTARPSASPAASPADAGTPATASASASASAAAAPAGAPAGGPWPPSGPAALPREFVADMMMLAMNKYEAQARSRQAPGRSVDTRH